MTLVSQTIKSFPSRFHFYPQPPSQNTKSIFVTSKTSILMSCPHISCIYPLPASPQSMTQWTTTTNLLVISWISMLLFELSLFPHSAPWYTCELQKLKTVGRALEWRGTASGLTVHRLAFEDHQKAYANSLKDTRSNFYSTIINSCPGYSKQLFSTINLLLKPQSQTHAEYSEEQCNKFLSFFKAKIDTIHSHLSKYPAYSPSPSPVFLCGRAE